MSSFENPHHLYLFAMTNGKKKLGYGVTPEDAYESLRLRLSEKELAAVLKDQHTRVLQKDLHAHAHELG